MSRYRPPQKPSSKYISAAGEKTLKDELNYLWKEERPIITQSVSEAAAMGDRSENADYIYGKKRLREIDRRVRYLSKRLEEVTVVSTIPDNTDKIYFGAKVTLEDEQGETFSYRLLGADEIDPSKGHVSIDAPLGRTLLGKELDTEVEVISPQGTKQYHILAIEY
ncbi:MAG: transcription elongation factor GreB [Gammaproteobacteria bacterium]|jgi:transcription elongation factor GreB|nr:transcription elongation factor GreB [Gammaproteobacteria bacterium]MBT3858894.1 transcription elongation factor GreB [Gammaproteobacteria bacterium]MBT3988222.1 transcription elongation factor GreB [Gammaproteobacteria bacterium]MBT4255237.1 transcription elongation factor GreB [Gammaproteobacteria bacterium]MBT4582492.1 transcription elongation factor GreB [Gammaproteobacteria bacterium]